MTHTDDILVKTLLRQLVDYERQLRPGDAILVQPETDIGPTTNPVNAEGFNWDEVDRCLRRMLATGLIHSGSVKPLPGIGIYFGGITETGRQRLR